MMIQKTSGETTKINFSVHENIIQDLIHSQNGTEATALRELVMNSVDAKATQCDIVVTENQFSVVDNGCGFLGKRDVEQYFSMFGTPHQKGDACFGRFRIGRGQIMALANVAWHSNTHIMRVDTQKEGMCFHYTDNTQAPIQGCDIKGDWYIPLSAYEIKKIRGECERYFGYMALAITFNGQSISVDPNTKTWDEDNENYCLRIEASGGVMIFNQGVYVKTFDVHEFGLSATVISKKPLVMNMARNELSSSDTLWREIYQDIKQRAKARAIKRAYSKRISTPERLRLIQAFSERELSINELLYIPLIKDIRGFSLSISALSYCTLPLTVAEQGCRLAERVATSRKARVLTDETLREFGVLSADELIIVLLENLRMAFDMENGANEVHACISRLNNKNEVSITPFTNKLKGNEGVIEESKLTLSQRIARNALQQGADRLAKALSKCEERHVSKRKVWIGTSATAEAWTNGVDRIVVNVDTLDKLTTRGRYAGVYFAHLLLHEFLHDASDSQAHQHDLTFMESFHDTVLDERNDIIGSAAQGIYQSYTKQCLKKNISLPKKIANEVNNPITGDQIQYQLIRNDKPITPLLKTVLSWFDTNCTFGKKAITFPLYYLHGHTTLGWWRVVLRRYDKKSIIEGADRETIAKQLYLRLGTATFDEAFFVRLVKQSDIVDIATMFTEHPVSGINAIRYQTPRMMTYTKSHKVEYEHTIGFPTREMSRFWSDNLESQKSNVDFFDLQEGRAEYAKQIIEHAVFGLSDAKERGEFIAATFAPDMQIHLKRYAEKYYDRKAL